MSLPGSPDTGVGISSIFSLFPPAKSPSGSTSLSNGELPVPNFSPSISSFFPPNNSPSSSESAPVKQSSPSISLLFPPTHSQSNSLSSTGTIHELANTICSIFRPNCSYSSSSESSHDQVTSKIKILDHEMEDVTSSYIEGLDQLRSGLLQQQKPFLQAPQPFHQLQKLTPQHQQLLLLAQQNLTSPSATEEECVDIEELLNMPNLLVEMAEGMLLSPPRFQSKSSSDESGGDGNGDEDRLWSHAY